jgi:hypothetical protein
MDGHEFDRTEPTVDSADQLVDHRAEVLVLFDVLTRWNGELHEDDLAYPLRVLLEEYLEGMEFLRNALDVVESVDADNNLYPFEAFFQLLDAGHDLFAFQTLWVVNGVGRQQESM